MSPPCLSLAVKFEKKKTDFIHLIASKRWKYFMDYSNQSDWISAVFSILFVGPLMINAEGSLHWQAGAIAVLNSWIGFLLYLQRYYSLWLTPLSHKVEVTNLFILLFPQVWGSWHLCCDVRGDYEDTGPYCVAVLLPDVGFQFGLPCPDAQSGIKRMQWCI